VRSGSIFSNFNNNNNNNNNINDNGENEKTKKRKLDLNIVEEQHHPKHLKYDEQADSNPVYLLEII
jgi:hypothetical protein